MARNDARLWSKGERADMPGARIVGIEAHGGGLLGQQRHEGIVHAVMHVNPLHRIAHLPRGIDRAAQHGGGRPFQIGAGGDDARVLPAQFQIAGNQPFGTGDRHLAPGGHAAGEADRIRLPDHRLADIACARHVSEHGGEFRDRAHGFEQGFDHPRGDFGWFQQHRRARKQRRDRIEQRQHQWRIPRRNHAHQRIGHHLRLHPHIGHRMAWRIIVQRGKGGGRILQPAGDIAAGDEALQVRSVAAAGIHRIGLADRVGRCLHRAQPARHDRAAPLHPQRLPRGLRGAQGGGGGGDIGGGGQRQLVIGRAGAGVGDGKAWHGVLPDAGM